MREYSHKSLSVKRLQYIIHFLLLSIMMPLRVTTKVLSFDTSSAHGSIALLEGEEVRAELRVHTSATHSTLLLNSVDFLLKRLNWKLEDLCLVAVGTGPGSFTGIRIGIATALGFSESLSIPYAGLSGLDALAFQARCLDGRIGAILDAHRSQAYYGEYESRGGKVRRVGAYSLFNLSDLERHICDRHLYIVGDTGKCLPGKASGWPRTIAVDPFLAAAIGRMAVSRRRVWRPAGSIMTEPTYIRPPDAVKNRDRKRG